MKSTTENGLIGPRIELSTVWVKLLVLWTVPLLGGAMGQAPVDVATAPPSSQFATLKATVRRVDVEVVVTDWDGNPVSGLRADDFKVEEDGVPQRVRSFDVSTPLESDADSSSSSVLLPANTFQNASSSAGSGTPAIILFDALNNAFAEWEFLKFLEHRNKKDPLAIFVLSDRLYLLKGFNEEIGIPEVKKLLLRYWKAALGNRSGFYNPRAAKLDALVSIARFSASMPGRKNLIWYSYGFPESLLPGPIMVIGAKNANPRPPAIGSGLMDSLETSSLDQIRQTTDLLALNHVAVYPVDVRGVVAFQNLGNTDGRYALQALQKSSMFNNAVKATMDTIANDTGGHAFYGSNDLAGSLKQATISGSISYSLTYEPTNPKFDGSLRHIKVTLKRPGYNLAYRRIYYADDMSASAQAAAEAQRALLPALERGTPLTRDLLVVAHLEAVGSPVAATPEELKRLAENQPAGNVGSRPQKKSRAEAPVMMQQYLVSLGLVTRQLELPANADGARRASLQLGSAAYDEDGQRLDRTESRIDDPISAERYAKLLASGYRVQQPISIPASAKTLRLAVRDVTGNRTGSLEIPLPLAKTADIAAPVAKDQTK